MAFQCSVATPEGLVFDRSVTAANLPAHDGLVGVLTDHAPALIKLGAGELKLSADGVADVTLFIAGGVAQVKDNVLTVLTDEATAIEKLDAAAARAVVADPAVAVTGEAAVATRQRKLDRARAILRATGNAA